MRWIKLVSSGTSATFTASISTPMTINKNAQVALKSMYLNTVGQNYIEVYDGITFYVLYVLDGTKYLTTLISGQYTADGFCEMVDDQLNRQLSYNNTQTTASTNSFQWKTSITDAGNINIAFNRSLNKAPVKIMYNTTNVQLNSSTIYNKQAGAADTAYIYSYLYGLLGNFVHNINVTPVGETAPVYNCGLCTNLSYLNITDNTQTLPLSAYIWGAGVDGSGNLCPILNGTLLTPFKNGDANITASTVTKISIQGAAGAVVAYLTVSDTVVGPLQIASSLDTAGLFRSDNLINLAITMNDNATTFQIANTSENLFYKADSLGQISPIVGQTLIVANLTGSTSKVTIDFLGNNNSAKFLGFNAVTYSLNAVAGFFLGNRVLLNDTLENIVVEASSMSQIESYDTEFNGYKRPILYFFGSLDIDATGGCSAEVINPIYLSLKNDQPMTLASFTIRICDSDGNNIPVSSGSVINLLINDDIINISQIK